MTNQTTQLCLLTPSCFEILFADVNGCLLYNPCKYIIQVESKMRMLGTLSYYSVKHKVLKFFYQIIGKWNEKLMMNVSGEQYFHVQMSVF